MSSAPNKKRKGDSFDADNVDYIASSTRELETIAFTWTLKDFSNLCNTDDDDITSPRFEGGPNILVDWVLHVYPKKLFHQFHVAEQGEAVKPYLSIGVHYMPHSNTSKNYPKLSAKYQYSLLDSEGKPLKQNALSPKFSEFNVLQQRIHWKFVELEELNDPAKRLLVDDTLKIHCRIWIKRDIQHKIDSVRNKSGASTVATAESLYRRMMELTQDFKKLLENSDFADVSLVTPTKTFRVHKNVLVARSPVFLAMFNSMMLESAQNSVEIPDFDADVVWGMLEYMYTGKVAGLEEKASELLRISDKYEVRGLKGFCEAVLEDNLKIETAAETLTLAHLHNAARLKSVAFSYINRNKERVGETKEFKELGQTNPSLLMELFLHKG